MSFDIDVVTEDPRWDDFDLLAICTTVLNVLPDLPQGAELVVLACDDTRIADLNADFRGKPAPTNVLSWPAQDRASDVEGGQPQPLQIPALGDIALAYETCMAEANTQDKTAQDHLTHLILHGVLHLMGYDHENDADAALMEGIETRLLATLGVSDPYIKNAQILN